MVGDKLQLNAAGDAYVHEFNERFDKYDGESGDFKSSFSSVFTISPEYAEELIADGYLCETEKPKEKFVNIFSEVDRLIGQYNSELNTIEEDYKDAPDCIKVEKRTVLNNIIRVLEHLKSLKK